MKDQPEDEDSFVLPAGLCMSSFYLQLTTNQCAINPKFMMCTFIWDEGCYNIIISLCY